MPEQGVINREKLDQCLQDLETQTDIALAVSGGPDSMALLLLADQWRKSRLERGKLAPDFTILTVDHGLRETAREECKLVMARAEMLGHEGEILSWSGEPPTSRIQEMAREIRYQMLAGACHARGIKTLLTAHHLDDQAETLLMRLARGSGVDGLAAMARKSRRYGVDLYRPLLDFAKKDLLAVISESGWKYVTDPSNEDQRFERVRLRSHAGELEKIGLDAEKIALSARRLRRARSALEELREQFLQENTLISDYGSARIDQLSFGDAPDEIALRALSKLLKICGGSHEMPNMARLESLVEHLREDFATNRTLAGCRIIAKGDFWLIVRESGRIREKEKHIEPGDCMFWDNRYIVCANEKATRDIVTGPLLDVELVRHMLEEEDLQKVPTESLASLLTFRLEGEIIAVPAFDLWSDASLEAGLKVKFITSDDGLL